MICTAATSYRRKRWVLPEHDALVVERLSAELRLPALVVCALLNRNLGDAAAARQFLEPKFKDLHSPWLLPNMEAAAARLAAAARNREKITLYGDYDVDGITGTAMLWHTLKAAGANVEYYIPHRIDEGYGLHVDAVQSLIEAGTQLLVTIDCGCSAIEPIALARARGVDVIVSDHHEFGAELPSATAIVHPRFPGSSYPNPDLCGAGVAFKLAWATAQKLCNAERVSETYKNLLLEFSALAALGTIADVVPLTGENRILVKYGLAQLARTQLPGLRAFIHAAGYGGPEDQGRTLDCISVGFTLAPRLNAAGRMGHAREAVELLTTATPERAEEIAQCLEAQNRTRQATERKMLELARAEIENSKLKIEGGDVPAVIVVAHESFHAGVVGIVASRLVDAYCRPAFVLSHAGAHLHGSARSVAGFELHQAIEHVRDLLISGGGHAMAGGVKLQAENLAIFRERLQIYASEFLTEDMCIPTLNTDGILTLANCDPLAISQLERLAPFGRGNPQPKYLLENVRLTAPPRRVGSTGAHLQLTIMQDNRAARCIAFKMGELAPQLPVGMELHLVVEPKIDTFNGRTKVDLVVCDIARADQEPFEA